MPIFPEYLIKSNDTRFAGTWDTWSYKILEALHYNPNTHSYTEQLEFVLRSNYTAPPKLTFARDIISAANFCKRNTYCDTYMIAYDADYCDYITMNCVLIEYMHSRRRHDFTVGVATAFGLTANLNTELLDYPLPNVNLLSISYLRG